MIFKYLTEMIISGIPAQEHNRNIRSNRDLIWSSKGSAFLKVAINGCWRG